MSDELPYEKEAIELLHLLKKMFEDENTILVILSCVIDYEEDVKELLSFARTPGVSEEDVLFEAFDIDDRRKIRRVRKMEEILDTANRLIETYDEHPEEYLAFQPEIKILEEYYASADWKADFEADESGEFPEDLKRGVLSEDGIYNLLERNREILRKVRKMEKETGEVDSQSLK